MANPDLINHNQTQIAKSVVRLCPGIWTAVGFAASTQHMIEGNTTVTNVDTSGSTKAAENVLAEFRNLTNKPVAQIIYTHSHHDYISGATVFSEGRDIPNLAGTAFASDLIGQNDAIYAPN